MRIFKSLLPFFILITLMSLVYFFGFHRALHFSTLKYHHNELTEFINNNPLTSPFLFMGIFAMATALSLPGTLLLSLLAGFLFPQPWSTLYVILGITTGAAILFLVAKGAFNNVFKKKERPRLAKLEESFHKNGAYYMLFLRFTPWLPVWVGHLVPAFFNVRLRTYVWTTLLGILPSAFICTQAGRGLTTIFESKEKIPLETLFSFEIKAALLFLSILTLIPLFLKKWKEKKEPN